MKRLLEDIEFVIFDTETTGLSAASGDRIVELAAIRCRGEQALGTFESLINPCRPVSAGAYNVNHISDDMLKDAPTADKVLPRFLDFISDSCVCSYNAPFDMSFLAQELKLSGLSMEPETVVIDILAMARKLLPGRERYSLCSVAESCGIGRSQEHRALADVVMTREVFDRLMAVLRSKGVRSFGGFVNLFSLDSKLLQGLRSEKVSQIRQAIDLGARVKIQYFSGTHASLSEREIVPARIVQENRTMYLVGFCSLRQQERTFRIDHILNIEMV